MRREANLPAQLSRPGRKVFSICCEKAACFPSEVRRHCSAAHRAEELRATRSAAKAAYASPKGKVTRFRACADSIFKQHCLRIKHRDLAARCARVLQNCFALSENRGRRECRMPNAPAASCVKKQTHELVTTVTPDSTRHSPRNGFTAYFALSPVTRLV